MRLDLLTASSINGIITGRRGENADEVVAWLGTPRSVMERKYEIRRGHGAGLVGTGTVVVDDPALTSHAVPGFRCVRITLDRRGRIPRHYRFFDGSARTLVGVCESTPGDYLDFLAERGVEAVVCGEDRIDLRAFLAGLEERGISSVLCEGGGELNRSLLREGLVDRIHQVVMPVVLDSGAPNLFEGPDPPARLRLRSVLHQDEYVWLEYEVAREVT